MGSPSARKGVPRKVEFICELKEELEDSRLEPGMGDKSPQS